MSETRDLADRLDRAFKHAGAPPGWLQGVDLGIDVATFLLGTADGTFQPDPIVGRIRAAALEWAAGQVAAAGCLCQLLLVADMFDGELVPLEPLLNGPPEALETWDGRASHDKDGNPAIDVHASRCPIALAAKIREGAP